MCGAPSNVPVVGCRRCLSRFHHYVYFFFATLFFVARDFPGEAPFRRRVAHAFFAAALLSRFVMVPSVQFRSRHLPFLVASSPRTAAQPLGTHSTLPSLVRLPLELHAFERSLGLIEALLWVYTCHLVAHTTLACLPYLTHV